MGCSLFTRCSGARAWKLYIFGKRVAHRQEGRRVLMANPCVNPAGQPAVTTVQTAIGQTYPPCIHTLTVHEPKLAISERVEEGSSM